MMATQACTCIARCNACICGSLPPAKPTSERPALLLPKGARVVGDGGPGSLIEVPTTTWGFAFLPR